MQNALASGTQVAARDLHRGRDVLLRLLGCRELLRRRERIALTAAAATAAACLASLRPDAPAPCAGHDDDSRDTR